MKKSIFLKILITLALGGLLSACASGATAASSWPGLAVNGEVAYLADKTHVYAINLSNGAQKWRFPEKADNKITFYADPVLTEDGQLIVGGYDNVLYSLNPENGLQNWAFTGAKNRYIASPLANSHGIFAPSGDGFLYALDMDGNFRWKFPTEHSQWGTPATDGDTVYLPSMDHSVYAIDAQTGEQVWRSEDLGGAVVSKPVLNGEGLLYVGTLGSEVLALRTSNGEILWRVSTTGWVWSAPALVDGFLYAGDLSGSIFVVDAANGSVKWQKQFDTSDKPAISGTPLLLGDALYFVSEAGALYAVDLSTGNPRWTKTFETQFYLGPLAAGDAILITKMGGDSLLMALDTNGNMKWEFIPPK